VAAARTFTVLWLLLFLLVVLVPFWWIASMSFKTYEQIQFAASIYVPHPFTWDSDGSSSSMTRRRSASPWA
jgi:ABC-type glycerol-3-phosphate transport system permease component